MARRSVAQRSSRRHGQVTLRPPWGCRIARWNCALRVASRAGGAGSCGSPEWVSSARSVSRLRPLGATLLPSAVAGASNPASLNCGTLVISGTDSNNYQFTEFTTGNATRGPNIDSGGSVAYGGSLTASNFTVAQNITPSAATPTALVGGSETGQLNLQKGSAVVAGHGRRTDQPERGSRDHQERGRWPEHDPLQLLVHRLGAGHLLRQLRPRRDHDSGTVTQLNPGFSTLGFYASGSVNVFNVTTDQVRGVKKIDFSVPAGSTTLVEVTPSPDFTGSLDLSGISSNIFYGCPSAPPNAGNSLWNNGNCGTQPRRTRTPRPSTWSGTTRSGTSPRRCSRRVTP